MEAFRCSMHSHQGNGRGSHLEIMAKEEVSTAALPMPLTTRSAKQTHKKDVGVFRKITKLKDAAETAQMTCPASSSVFLCTSLHSRWCPPERCMHERH